MRSVSIFMMLMGITAACSQNTGTGKSGNTPEEKIRNQVIITAIDYASGRLTDSKQSVDKNGIITLTEIGMSYIIDPAKIIINEIDEDSEKDAVVPLDILYGQTLVMKEHLILLNTGGKMVIAKTIYNVIKILKIEDRIIVAEISKVGMDSPTYGCAECIEVAKYQFRGGVLVKTE
jgi:hypothetical protein